MENLIHELWLIYTEWGENGDDPYKLPELRERLGKVINALNATNPAAIIGRQGGQKGGSAKTEAKREAARANGAKGGRPREATQFRVVASDGGKQVACLCPYCGSTRSIPVATLAEWQEGEKHEFDCACGRRFLLKKDGIVLESTIS